MSIPSPFFFSFFDLIGMTTGCASLHVYMKTLNLKLINFLFICRSKRAQIKIVVVVVVVVVTQITL